MKISIAVGIARKATLLIRCFLRKPRLPSTVSDGAGDTISARVPETRRETVLEMESMRTWLAVTTTAGASMKLEMVLRFERERTMVPTLEIIISHCSMYR